MLKDANSKPRPLSSQPSRKWGDEPLPKAPSSNDIEWALNSQDWPASPPPKPKPKAKPRPDQRKPSAFSASVSSRAATSSGSGSGSANLGRANNTPSAAAASSSSSRPPARPLAPLPSKSSLPNGQLAPFFRPANPRPSASTTAASGPSAAAVPKKRVMPWENIVDQQPRQPRPNSTFHTVGGSLRERDAATANSKAGLLTSSTMNIKQKVVLSPEQQMVLKLVVDDGRNVFFTGSAGTGKSVLLREIILALKNKFKGRADAVAVTASTGMAACNIGGLTIHSFSGVGLGKDPVGNLIDQVRKNKKSSGRWARTQVLVIDEISMIDGILFDKIAGIAQAMKKRPGMPFGGIQLVVTGDFFQLPPVTKGIATFAFEAKSWKDTIGMTVNLTQVFRQKSTEFIDMLNEMRFGELSAASIAKFKNLSHDRTYEDGVEPTELFPRREDVDRSNQARLAALPGEVMTYKAEDWCENQGYGAAGNTYLQNFMAPEKLVLKVGAQVMLIKNLDVTLVNGTVGIVVGFGVSSYDEDEGVKEEEDEAQQKKKLKFAAAVGAGTAELAPIIDWRTPTGIERQVSAREDWKVENQKGEKLATRKQYPIILAWAMSIHKSQGQTLPRVKVDLRKVFEKGQSYVALSRATCLDGLQVIGFDAKKVEAHPKVVAWSKTLLVLT